VARDDFINHSVRSACSGSTRVARQHARQGERADGPDSAADRHQRQRWLEKV